MTDARKERIDADQAWAMIQGADSISVAKGKKVQRFEDVAAEKEMVLKNVMGPSGNLRAPTYRVGNDYVVGFNLDMYQDWVK
ncbi:hypothetical protein SAMN02745165_01299 [Malonomonas rubra DSM 5091]|uniref:Uncharacterized protein n=1 Tax=Malonomonas rubra DSM 5091 TaxID=1122189 RepID=A0A1M6FI90_MALRU|nr:hypothetical protein SAMN02745165_01299 [Malonomonas rubra DSM 5091]